MEQVILNVKHRNMEDSKMQQNDYFKGWYFKCSNENKTIAFILQDLYQL